MTLEPASAIPSELTAILDRQRQAFDREREVSYSTRVDRLDRCIALVLNHQDTICEAVNADFGVRSRHVTRMSDLITSINSLKFVKKHLKSWMRVERRRALFPMNLFGARSEIHYQPKGVVGIMSPWKMQEELFGPILCLKPYRRFDECIDDINQRPRPLALYYFGKDKAEQEQVIAQTISGGMSINDIAVHFACDDMPFGGIGASGMGHFHGREGFKTFSHAKSVFKQGVVNLPKLAGSLPPYGDKLDKMLRKMLD